MLPEFLILGAPKCGTTSLAATLAQHPELFIPERKEPGYFDQNWERGVDWFARYFEAAGDDQLRGEATPEYFATPISAERIARTNPACKLIVITRDPVARAQSHYWFRWNTGRERRPIEQVLAEETSSDEATARGYLVRHGLYGRNLEVYRKLFGADRILVIGFDELIRESAGVLAECQRFLAVTPRPLVLEQANAARKPYVLSITRAITWLGEYQGPPKRWLRQLLPEMPRKQVRSRLLRALSRAEKNPPLAATTRARLRELFADDTARFQAALGRPLSWYTVRRGETA